MNRPFLLKPTPKDYLWGGSRMNDDFNKGFLINPVAESWECSTHPDGVSRAGDKLLSDLLKAHPEMIGSHPLQITGEKPILPILIKFIDAKLDLSIQVHPTDEYAMAYENSWGKTEVWYVVNAKKGAELIYGFKQDMKKEQIRSAIDKGSLPAYLNHVSVNKGDVFYIEAGTVHAIGAGCLVAEVQENSNITYRLFDYNRVDKNGNKRDLQIEKALDVANLKSSVTPRQPMRVLRYRKGCASELLSRCKYFQVNRLLLNTEIHRELFEFQTGTNSFHALLCVDGCGSISGDNVMINFFKGDCVFVPANSTLLRFHGRAELLEVSC